MLTEVGLIDPSFRLLQVARDYTTLLNYGNFRGNRVICDQDLVQKSLEALISSFVLTTVNFE